MSIGASTNSHTITKRMMSRELDIDQASSGAGSTLLVVDVRASP